MQELSPGSVIAGRFRLERRIGEGGMGEVWAALHLITRKPVAIKVLKPEATRRQDLVRRFFREARAASAVRHPNVVAVHDVLDHEGSPVMVMDLLRGESLADRIERDQKLSLAEFAGLIVPAMGAVAAAHASGVVHRDLKPENIFLAREDGDCIVPKVLDFGIAKLSLLEGEAAHTAALTRTGSMMGTPYYMAPEQAFGEKDVDWRVDVWALGVIAYECLTGDRPFAGDNFGQVFKAVTTTDPPALVTVCPELPPAVSDLVKRMLSRQREARPELREVLEVFSAHTGVHPPSWAGPSGAVTIRQVRDTVDTVAASVLPATSSRAARVETADTLAVPSLAGEAVGQTVGQTALSPGVDRPKRARRVWLSLGAAAAGLAGLIVWAFAARSEGESPAADVVPTSPVHAEQAPPPMPTDRPVVEPTAEPAPGTPEAPADAGRSAESQKQPSSGRKPARQAATTTQAPPDNTSTGPKRLPGGILDQEKAPF